MRKINRPKHNPKIFVSNYCRKITQLERIISHLCYESDNLRFQRCFLNTFFDPKIETAIEAYRNHINKMQKTSEDDRVFIIERTDRFYNRKYNKLIKEQAEMKDNMIKAHNNIMKSIRDEISRAKSMINQYNVMIQKTDIDLKKITDTTKKEMTEKIHLIKNNSVIEIASFNKSEEEKRKAFEEESVKHCQQKYEEHMMMMQNLKNNFKNGSFFDLSSLHSLKVSAESLRGKIFDGKMALMTMKQNHNISITQSKNKMTQLIKEIKQAMTDAANEKEKMGLQLFDLDAHLNQIKTDLCQENERNISERTKIIQEILSQLELLKRNNKAQLEKKRIGLGQDSSFSERELQAFAKSLDDNYQTVVIHLKNIVEDRELKFKQNQNKIISTQEINAKIRKNLKIDFDDQEKRFKAEYDKAMAEYKAIREKQIQMYKNELEEKSNLLNNKQKNNEIAESQQKQIMDGLIKEKDNILMNNSQAIKLFSEETEVMIKDFQESSSKTTENILQDLQSDMTNFEESQKNIIEEIKIRHAREAEELRQKLYQNGQEEIDNLKNSSSNMYLSDIEKNYRDEYMNLQNSLGNIEPPTPKSSIFENMALVLADLQHEIEDHKMRLMNQKKHFIQEWEAQIESEEERHKKSFAPSHTRGRDQLKQSLQKQISQTRTTKESEETRLNSILKELSAEYEKIINNFQINKLNASDSNDEMKLRELYEKETNETTSAIQLANFKIQKDLKAQSVENQKHSEQIQKKIDAVSQQIKMQLEFFMSKNEELNVIMQKNQQNYLNIIKESEQVSKQAISDNKHRHANKAKIISTQSNDIKFRIAKSAKENEDEASSLESKFSKALNDYNNKMQKEIQDKKFDWEGMLGYFSEKIEQLTKKRNKFVEMFENLASRPCDIDKIESLQMLLQTKNMQLSNALQNLTKYKAMYKEQETRINAKFGISPEVGTLQLSGKYTPQPQIV